MVNNRNTDLLPSYCCGSLWVVVMMFETSTIRILNEADSFKYNKKLFKWEIEKFKVQISRVEAKKIEGRKKM